MSYISTRANGIACFYPDTIRAGLTLVTDLACIDAIGIYDTGTRWLVSVEIDGEQYSPDQVEQSFKIMRTSAESGWSDPIDKQYALDLINEAIERELDN